ncbi:putative membrane protein [Campylobacter blaseri]|uniref:DUF3899 domain-containing protein n=1 Tax=Campylobacter blaseri TaxID=2042961 RepID=A0A2P8R2E3_9BACT|nr:hypothetical protein [Campylobacter blaseri]PSM52674.1 hypothetical protein CQ405_02780 [Campylobacter blaseri]PSM54322.1 hypothetical protein CRN67_02780 [Campylobacter blaseri]QKF85974.1 putative membrane protein [Campylobacter blaseri]
MSDKFFSVALFCFIVSVGLFAKYIFFSYNKKNFFGIMAKDDFTEYRRISKIKREKRSEQEQEFYLENQEQYVGLMITKWVFYIGIVFVFIGIIIKYIFE